MESLKLPILLPLALLMVVVFAVCYLVMSGDHGKSQEGYRKIKEDIEDRPVRMFFTDDPVATGIVRPLWGPLLPLEKNDNRYMTIRSLPWCLPGMKQYPQCQEIMASSGCRAEVPYENNKI